MIPRLFLTLLALVACVLGLSAFFSHFGQPVGLLPIGSVESITLFDEVDLYHRNGSEVCVQAESYFRSSDAFHGQNCLEIRLTQPQGSVTWTLPPTDIREASRFRFAWRKSRSEVRVDLAMNGPTGTFWIPLMAGDTSWHEEEINTRSFSQGGVCTGFTLRVSGKAGDCVYFDHARFLRPAIPGQAGIILAGRTEPARDGVRVEMRVNGRVETTQTVAGRFAFPYPVQPGDIVAIRAVAPNGAWHYPEQGRLIEVDPRPPEIIINLADLRDANRNRGLVRSHRFQQIFDGELGIMYQPKSFFDHGGIGVPQEFQNRLQVNNLGFLDRDRRPDNLDHLPRVLLMGACDLFGHSVPRHQHPNVVLEALLLQQTGRRHEVISLADMNINFGRFWRTYDRLGRAFHPRIVVMTLASGSVLIESDPELLCRCYEYDPEHLPYWMFRSRGDGSLEMVPADPEYPFYTARNPALKAHRDAERTRGGHRYYVDGIDWVAVLHREDGQLPARTKQALDHLERIIRFYRDELRKDGAELVVLIQPLLGMQQYADKTEWRDAEGARYRSDLYARRMMDLLRRNEIHCLDLADWAARHYPDPTLYFWRNDKHPSAYGFDWLAEALAEYLQSEGLLQAGSGVVRDADRGGNP